MEIRTENTNSKFFVKYNNDDVKESVDSAVRHLQDTSRFAEFLGVRFERRVLKVGDEVGKSKSNFGRDDVREFPEYGTPEYDSLETLPGACAYDVDMWRSHILDRGEWTEMEADIHLYVIEGDGIDKESGEDDDEVIISNAEVMAVIF